MRQPKEYFDIALAYADGVVAGAIPANKYVKLAAQRFLNDLETDDIEFRFTFDMEKAWRACAFIENLPHVKGEWAARRDKIRLQPWQVFIIANLFGWVHKASRLRRYRRALILVPRKNGKSLIAAGVGLYMAFADGEAGAEVYSGATSLDQAMEIFRPAKQMVERTPRMVDRFQIEVQARSLTSSSTGARFLPVVGKPGDGASPSCALIDELHEHQTSELYECMRTGMGARRQPLLLAISTAGDNAYGPCFDAMLEAQKVLEGLITDDHLFAALYGLDPEDDWTDARLLAKSNPNLGVSVSREWLESELESALQNPRRQATFQIKHCNRWVGSRAQFFNVENFRRAGDEGLTLAAFEGRRCILALDLASKQDLTALMALFPPKEAGERYAAFGRYFLPEEALKGANADSYRLWREQGRLRVTEGAMLDQDAVYDAIVDFRARFDVTALLYDPWGAHGLISRLNAEGAPCCEFGFNVRNLSEPMKALGGWIDDGRIAHDGDEVLTWAIGNIVSTVDSMDRVYPRREGRETKIDPAVALIMAVGGCLADEAQRYGAREPRIAWI